MTVTYSDYKSASSKLVPPLPVPYVPVSSTNTWTRPSDWPALPSVTSSDNKIAGLMAVFNDENNYVAFNISTASGANYTVDWGDGLGPQSYASGVLVGQRYTYSTLGTSVTSRGYKTAIITITVTGTTFSSVSFNQKYPTNAPTTLPAARWLDMVVSVPNATTLVFAGSVPVINFNMLEQLSVLATSTSSNIGNYMCASLVALQSVPTFNPGGGSFANLSNTFLNCISLKYAPNIGSTSSASVGMPSTFNGCSSLVYVPVYPFKPNDLASCFNGCTSLQKAPNWDLSLVTNMTSTFNNCKSLLDIPPWTMPTSGTFTMNTTFNGCTRLTSVPYINTNKCTSFTGTFTGCSSLTIMPPWDTSNATTVAQMFSGCVGLSNLPVLNTSNVTNMFQMFNNCTNLEELPILNTSNVSNMNSTFSGCSSLANIPAWDTSKVTEMGSIFINCSALLTIPTLNTSNVVNASSMFNGCASLNSIPLIDTSNVTNMTSMFASTKSLETIPALVTSKVTIMDSMFTTSSFKYIPDLDTSNVTSMITMFTNATYLIKAPAMNTSKVTAALTMFNNCTMLNEVPNYDLSNVTTTTSTFAATCRSLGRMRANMRLTFSVANSALGKNGLEEMFTAMIGNTTAQTVTITGNYGADTAISSTLSSGTPAGSTTLTVASNASYTVGQWCYNAAAFADTAVTFTASTSIVTKANHGLSYGTRVSFPTIVTTTGITVYTIYYVVSNTTNTFQVALTNGGAPITLTNNGTGTMRYEVYITGKVGGTQLTISAPTTATTTATALTARTLNTYLATLKNWAITG